jgi:Ca2+-binding RTX toxin-like protein
MQSLPGNVVINGGTGHDSIQLLYVVNHTQVTVSGGAGADYYYIGGGEYYGLTVSTNSVAGTGDTDRANLVAATVKGAVDFVGGAGDDEIDIRGAALFDGPINSSLGDGRNFMIFRYGGDVTLNRIPTLNGALTAVGGKDFDTLGFDGAKINGVIAADFGDGNDNFVIGSSAALEITLGAGDDTVRIGGTFSGRLDGGPGFDALTRVTDNIGSVQVANFEA